MPLETLDQGPRIQDLVIDPVNEPEICFDTDKELTPERWADLKEELDYFRKNEIARFLTRAWESAYVWPDRKQELGLDKDVFQRGQNCLNPLERLADTETARSIYCDAYIYRAGSLKLTFPNETASMTFSLDMFESVRLASDEPRKRLGTKYFHFLFYSRFLYPQQFATLPIDDDLYQDINAEIKSAERSENWFRFLQTLFYSRMLFPDRYQKDTISPASWRACLEYFRGHTKDKIKVEDLPEAALELKVLAADRIIIHDNGFEIIEEKSKFEDSQPPSPPASLNF